MRFGKHTICVTREKSHLPADKQREALTADGCNEWLSLDEPDGELTLINRLRKNDIVKVRHFHVLAPKKRRTDHNPRKDLWALLHQIEERGAHVLEISTGRSTANQRERDMMIADAIEVITRGARAVAARARENGKAGGRPAVVIPDDRRELARSIWFERQELVGKRLKQSMRRLGFSMARCYREFGPRGGRPE